MQTLAYFGERKINSTVKVATALLTLTNVTTSTIKDSLGRTIKTTNPEYETSFDYDPAGQQLKATRTQGSTTQTRLYGQDARGFLLSERHPETGPNGNGTITYTRDAFGQVRGQVHGGRNLTYVYDGGARLTKIKDTAASGKVWKEWAWASSNSAGNYTKGKIFQAKRHNYPLNNAIDWTVVENYDYRGALGQLSQKRTLINFPHLGTSTPTFTLDLTYDALGNRTTIDYPKCTATACNGTGDLPAPAHVATTSYNQGMVTQVNSSRAFSGLYTYHPNFQLAQLDYSNGVVGTFSEGTDGMSRPRQLTYKKGGTLLFDTGAYEYDGAGNIFAIGADRYIYDQANRLAYGTVIQGGSRWETYLYDDFDNITAGQKESSKLIEFKVNPATNRYTGDVDDMQYDSTGNLIQLGAPDWVMSWDAFDMQTNFTSLREPQSNHLYAYGPGDYRLVTLDTNTQEITYDFRDLDGAVLREYTLTGSGAAETWSNWKHEKDFVYGPEGLLGSVTRTGNRFFSHKDHLGTPRAISDVAGVLQGRHDYYPFGHEVERSGQVDEPMVKFTGHQRDAHGLSDYMLGRTCLWPLRRFASVDHGRDGWNLYAYVGNNPIRFIDPDGLQRYLIVVGEAGLGDHDVGENFQRVAATRQAELEAAGNTVEVRNVGSVPDLNEAITTGEEIDGGIIYVGHGSYDALYIGEGDGADTNLTNSNVSRLSNENLSESCTIQLLACFTGSGETRSIGQSIADQLNRPVIAPSLDMSFSHDATTYLSAPGTRPPATGPLHMVVNPRGTYYVLTPR